MKKTWIRKTLSVGVLAAGALLIGPAAMAHADHRPGHAPKTESLQSSQNLLGNGAFGNAAHQLAHGGFGGAQSQVSPGLGHGLSNFGQGFSKGGYRAPSVGHVSPSAGHLSPTLGHASSSFGHTSPTFGHKSPTFGHISPGLGNGTRTFTHTQTHTKGADHYTPGLADIAHAIAHNGEMPGGQQSGGQMSGGYQSGGGWDTPPVGNLGNVNGATTSSAIAGPVNICGNSLSFLSQTYTQATCSNTISGDVKNVKNVKNVKGVKPGQGPDDDGDVAGDNDDYPTKDNDGDVRGDGGYDGAGEAPDTAGYGDEMPGASDAGDEMPTAGDEPSGDAMDDKGYGGELPDEYSGDNGGRGDIKESTTLNKVAGGDLGGLRSAGLGSLSLLNGLR